MDSRRPERTLSLEEPWLKSLPQATMVYPDKLWDRLKYLSWRLYTPYHQVVRDTALAARIVQHEGRQDFLLGQVAPHLSAEAFVSYLIERGYGNHFVAWKDDGEIVSLRYVENFKYQYHLRVFEDGEVRAHYEYTPECHPISHMQEINIEPRREEFLRLLGDTIISTVS